MLLFVHIDWLIPNAVNISETFAESVHLNWKCPSFTHLLEAYTKLFKEAVCSSVRAANDHLIILVCLFAPYTIFLIHD